MEIFYFAIICVLFIFAVIDLNVGVSNDAVNFLNSAVGAKAASLRTILIVAAIGIFIGASTSNGMMDIARHGMFQPEHFYFRQLMCVFLAVTVTDVVLLDIFNSLGMPTSTTVSMVFELLGASFAISLIKINSGENLEGVENMADLLNTGKALEVIAGIFLSVAIAFFFGTLVQWLTRLVFTFTYRVGNKILNLARLDAEAMIGNNNQSKAVNHRWRKEGDNTSIPRAMFGAGSNYNTLISDRFVEDGSFLRLNYIQLSYELNRDWVKSLGLRGVRCYMSANNLFCLTRYSGYDPEVNSNSSPLMPGIDANTYPKNTACVIGLELKF